MIDLSLAASELSESGTRSMSVDPGSCILYRAAKISGDSLLMMRLVFLSIRRGAVHLPLYPGWALSYTCLHHSEGLTSNSCNVLGLFSADIQSAPDPVQGCFVLKAFRTWFDYSSILHSGLSWSCCSCICSLADKDSFVLAKIGPLKLQDHMLLARPSCCLEMICTRLQKCWLMHKRPLTHLVRCICDRQAKGYCLESANGYLML